MKEEELQKIYDESVKAATEKFTKSMRDLPNNLNPDFSNIENLITQSFIINKAYTDDVIFEIFDRLVD